MLREVIKTTTELAKGLRKELKEIGYNNKKVKVKKQSEDKINVTIIDATVNKDLVEKIANNYEEVDKDDKTNEILAGGNTFVSIENKSVDKEIECKLSNIYFDIENVKDVKSFTIKEDLELQIFNDDDILEYKIVSSNQTQRCKRLINQDQILKDLTLFR